MGGEQVAVGCGYQAGRNSGAIFANHLPHLLCAHGRRGGSGRGNEEWELHCEGGGISTERGGVECKVAQAEAELESWPGEQRASSWKRNNFNATGVRDSVKEREEQSRKMGR